MIFSFLVCFLREIKLRTNSLQAECFSLRAQLCWGGMGVVGGKVPRPALALVNEGRLIWAPGMPRWALPRAEWGTGLKKDEEGLQTPSRKPFPTPNPRACPSAQGGCGGLEGRSGLRSWGFCAPPVQAAALCPHLPPPSTPPASGR